MSFWGRVGDLFYPRFCCHCGKMGEFLCSKCYSELEFLLESDLELNLGGECFLDGTQALLNYNQLLSKMMHQYKYLGVRDLGETFAYWLYQFLELEEVEALIYIPIHRKRMGERGYNQAKIIAQELGRYLGVPVIPGLKRLIHREKQAKSKNASERWGKGVGIFGMQGSKKLQAEWIKKYPRVMIVDDVITTGTTINEAARVLKEAGFQQVRAVGVCHGN